MIRLYRVEDSTNCERVALALAHKALDVESVVVDYEDREVVERVSGQWFVPVIEDAGEVVSDSIAILRHLEERNPEPPLFPDQPAGRAEMDLFLDWFEHRWKPVPDGIEDELDGPSPDAERVERLSAELASLLDVFERLLAGRDHLLGDGLSAADCAAFPFLKYARGRDPADDHLFHVILAERQPLGEDHPALAAWIERMSRLPRAYGSSVEA